MIGWDSFIYFSLPALLCWCYGAWAAWRGKRSARAMGATLAGIVLFFVFIAGLWLSLERPPLRTMGETRLWYAAFMPVTGLMVYSRWRYKWILLFSTVMSAVFIAINILRPEMHSKALMPALQSPWFAPHVMVYMFAYALMGAAALMAAWMLLPLSSHSGTGHKERNGEMELADNLVRIGTAFITIGMLFGALWAKEAWGHYWTWDPKETWAAATWLSCLVYIHFRLLRPDSHRTALVILIVSFFLLQMCWWGINYLPSAQATSVHTYTT